MKSGGYEEKILFTVLRTMVTEDPISDLENKI
jgi:hypothetical protein